MGRVWQHADLISVLIIKLKTFETISVEFVVDVGGKVIENMLFGKFKLWRPFTRDLG